MKEGHQPIPLQAAQFMADSIPAHTPGVKGSRRSPIICRGRSEYFFPALSPAEKLTTVPWHNAGSL